MHPATAQALANLVQQFDLTLAQAEKTIADLKKQNEALAARLAGRIAATEGIEEPPNGHAKTGSA